MDKYNVHPDELYALVKEYNRKCFLLRQGYKKNSTIIIEHYKREVKRIKNLCYKKYGIVLD